MLMDQNLTHAEKIQTLVQKYIDYIYIYICPFINLPVNLLVALMSFH